MIIKFVNARYANPKYGERRGWGVGGCHPLDVVKRYFLTFKNNLFRYGYWVGLGQPVIKNIN